MQTIFSHLRPVNEYFDAACCQFSIFILRDGMSVILSKQLYGQLFVQIYSEVKSASGEDSSWVENIYPL